MENLGKDLKLQIYKLLIKNIIKLIKKDRDRLKKSSIRTLDIIIGDLRGALKFNDLEELKYLLNQDRVALVADKIIRYAFHVNRDMLNGILKTSNFSIAEDKVVNVLHELKDIEDLDFKDKENKED